MKRRSFFAAVSALFFPWQRTPEPSPRGNYWAGPWLGDWSPSDDVMYIHPTKRGPEYRGPEIDVKINSEDVVDAARALAARIRAVALSPEYESVWGMHQLRWGNYSGPTFHAELKLLETTIANLDRAGL